MSGKEIWGNRNKSFVCISLYREFWELTGRYKLAQIYDEARYNLSNLFKLHNIVKGLEMEENDVIRVLELAKHNELERLQWKVEYLENQIFMLEIQKTKATHDILKLNRTIDELQSFLPQNGGRLYDTDNLYPICTEPDTHSYSIQLSYTDYWP